MNVVTAPAVRLLLLLAVDPKTTGVHAAVSTEHQLVMAELRPVPVRVSDEISVNDPGLFSERPKLEVAACDAVTETPP